MGSQLLPPELNQPLPRRVKLSRSTIFLTFMITALFPGLGLCIIGTTYNGCHERAILKESGTAADARITNMQIQYGKGSRVYHYITYQFNPANISSDNAHLTSTKMTAESNFSSLGIGQPIPVLYDPKNPNNSDININDVLHTSNPYGIMPFIIEITGGMFGASYAFVMCSLFSSYFKEKKLLQWGNVARAQIIKQEEISGRAPSITATYEFIDTHGQNIQSTQKYLPSGKPQKSYERLKAITDNPIALYNAENSHVSMLYRTGMFFCSPPNDDTHV